MGDPPHGKSLDRKDGNRDYEKENCRWATPLQQSQNRRTNIINHEKAEKIRSLKTAKFSISEIAKIMACSADVVRNVVYKGAWKKE